MDFDIQFWEALKKAALLGTDRGHLPDRVRDQLRENGISSMHSPQRAVLEGAVLFHKLSRAAAGPEPFTGVLPSAPSASAHRYITQQSAYHLQLILEGRFRRALPEFIWLLVENGRQFPPESLPALFGQALAEPAFWRSIEPAVGPVGRWLIELHPHWSELTAKEEVAQWSTGSRAQRQNLFARLREENPEKARSLLASDWDRLDFREKVALLDRFEAALALADEPWLEKCLDDRRQEVRQRAADLLARLSQAALPQRVFQALKPFLSLNEAGDLQVTLPDRLEPAWRRDGIAEKTPDSYRVGRKEGWLLQMLARVPPASWAEVFERDAAGCIHLFAGAGQAVPWLRALAEAAWRYHDNEWMEALLTYWSAHDLEQAWKNDTGERLIDALSGEAFNRVALRALRHSGRLPGAGSLIVLLLERGRHAWSEQLSVQFIRALQEWLAELPSFGATLPAYRAVMEATAYRSDPELIDQLRRGWPLPAPAWRQWEQEVENLLNTLMFRREMRRAFD